MKLPSREGTFEESDPNICWTALHPKAKSYSKNLMEIDA